MKLKTLISFSSLLKSNIVLETTDFKGVLSEIYHKNPSKYSEYVECSAGESGGSTPPSIVCLPTNHSDKFWYTKDSFSYFQIHLKTLSIFLRSYKIQSENKGPGNAHLQNWKFTASNDESTWISLHEERNYSALNDSSFFREFPVNATQKFSFFRITQTGPSCCSFAPNRMAIQQVELYGNVITCYSSIHHEHCNKSITFYSYEL